MYKMRTLLKSLFVTALLIAGTAAAQTPTPIPAANYTPFVVGLSGFDLDNAESSPRHALGIPYWGAQGLYVYGQATESISAGAVLIVNQNSAFSLADTTEAGSTSKRICVATADMTTTNRFGWAWCGGGPFEAFVASGVSAGDALTTTGTGGVAGAGGDAIIGCTAVDAGVGDTTRVTIFCTVPART